jgi:hypothetical protein
MMATHDISLREKVEDLLLNQALSKADVVRIVKVSKFQLNRILTENEAPVSHEQAAKINTLYARLKHFESQIEEHIPPLVYNRNMQSDLARFDGHKKTTSKASES